MGRTEKDGHAERHAIFLKVREAFIWPNMPKHLAEVVHAHHGDLEAARQANDELSDYLHDWRPRLVEIQTITRLKPEAS